MWVYLCVLCKAVVLRDVQISINLQSNPKYTYTHMYMYVIAKICIFSEITLTLVLERLTCHVTYQWREWL